MDMLKKILAPTDFPTYRSEEYVMRASWAKMLERRSLSSMW